VAAPSAETFDKGMKTTVNGLKKFGIAEFQLKKIHLHLSRHAVSPEQ
jgi:hypothetical protein